MTIATGYRQVLGREERDRVQCAGFWYGHGRSESGVGGRWYLCRRMSFRHSQL